MREEFVDEVDMSDLDSDDTPAQGQDRELREFFERYAWALTSGAAPAIAALWAAPALVLGEEGEHAVTSVDEVAAFFAGAKEQYTARGITDTRPELLRTEWLTPNVVTADVRWPYFDAAGNALGEESSVYTLKRDASGELKIRIAVMKGASTQH